MPSVDEEPIYIHLPKGKSPPPIDPLPCRMVILIEDDVSPEWQDEVSKWVVKTGCLYMMAWGENCSSWDDSVDFANLEDHDYNEIPDDKFVMTTWHDDEPVEEVFWYCRMNAHDPNIALPTVFIVHISPVPRGDELLSTYRECLDEE